MTVHLSLALTLLLVLCLAVKATGQEAAALLVQSAAVEASGPESRLRQLEGIYQQQLRTRHIPLLGEYLTELQQIARQRDSSELQAEIKKIQSLISAGGLVDLAAAARELNPNAPLAVMASNLAPKLDARPKSRTPSITLTPSFAQSIIPQPPGSSSPVAARIGQMTWRIDHLNAGDYDLILHFASLSPDAAVPVKVEYSGQVVEMTLAASQATKDARTFRLTRLGRLHLAEATHGMILSLAVASIDAPGLLVRHLVIAPTRD